MTSPGGSRTSRVSATALPLTRVDGLGRLAPRQQADRAGFSRPWDSADRPSPVVFWPAATGRARPGATSSGGHRPARTSLLEAPAHGLLHRGPHADRRRHAARTPEVACRKAGRKGPRNPSGHPPALPIMPSGRRRAWPTARPRASHARFTPLYAVIRHGRGSPGSIHSALTRGFTAFRSGPLYGRQTAPQGGPEGITPGQCRTGARGPILRAVFDHSPTRATRERTGDLNRGPISRSVRGIGFLPGVLFLDPPSLRLPSVFSSATRLPLACPFPRPLRHGPPINPSRLTGHCRPRASRTPSGKRPAAPAWRPRPHSRGRRLLGRVAATRPGRRHGVRADRGPAAVPHCARLPRLRLPLARPLRPRLTSSHSPALHTDRQARET